MCDAHKLWLLNEAEGEQADFSGSSLSFHDFSRLDLRRAIFCHAFIFHARFNGALLAGADFCGAFLEPFFRHTQVRFCGADLQDAHFSNACLYATDFSNAKLSSVNFKGADLMLSSFRNCKLSNANFAQSTLDKSNFTGACCEQTNFTQAHLHDAKLCEIDGRHAKFTLADLTNADFSRADLRFADFQFSYAQGTNFAGANFDEARQIVMKGSTCLATDGLYYSTCAPL
jgi:uncharacterized protein YjbI with pentapeptide repeats